MACTEKPFIVVLSSADLDLLFVGVDGERFFFRLPVLLGDADGGSFSLPLLWNGVHRGTGEEETVGVRVIIPKASFAGL